MAAVSVSSRSAAQPLPAFGSEHQKEQTGQKDPGYSSLILKFVYKHRDETVTLKNPAGATLTIGNFNSTIYRGKKNVLNGWNNFYLPDIVSMKVLGVVKGTSCPEDHLVLMTCEDQKVYAYDGEELHLVASSLKQLRDEGIQYPADKSYYKGDAFPNTDWDEVRKSAVGRRLDQKHRELVTAKTSKLLKNLRSIRLKTGHEDTRVVIKTPIQQQDGSLKRPLDCTNNKLKLRAVMDGFAHRDAGRMATNGLGTKHPLVGCR